MPCFAPLSGWKSKTVNASGKRSIVFNRKNGYCDLPVTIPCGQCIGCRLERSRQWAIRCVHESKLHDDNAFLTLTYDNDHLPLDGSLNKKHFQDFMKRYRKYLGGDKIRYYHCGEYGEELRRPHYHAIIFGHDFSDKKYWKTEKDNQYFTSAALNKIWGKGQCVIGTVTFNSCAYVARYVLKKVTGEKAEEHYSSNNLLGEETNLVPEYTTMSRNKGIGHEWYQKYKDEVYPDDFIVLNGMKMKPPKYYEQFFAIDEEEQFIAHKSQLRKKAKSMAPDNTRERLLVRETCTKAKLGLKSRNLEAS